MQSLDIFIWKYATPILLSLVAFAVVWQTASRIGLWLKRTWDQSSSSEPSGGLSQAGLLIFAGLVGNATSLVAALPLFLFREPTPRTMAMFLTMIVSIELMTLTMNVRISRDTERSAGPFLQRIAGNLLCISPMFVGLFILSIDTSLHHLDF